MGVSENVVYILNPMVLLIIIPTKNGYFIGGIPHFQTYPHEKTMRNCGKNPMKWQWTEETRRNIGDLFNTLALFEMSKISGEVWKSSHSD